MNDLCDYCDVAAPHRIEIQVKGPVQYANSPPRMIGTGRFIRACDAHRKTAQLAADNFVSATAGSLADEIEQGKAA